jgi:hypothetical protein
MRSIDTYRLPGRVDVLARPEISICVDGVAKPGFRVLSDLHPRLRNKDDSAATSKIGQYTPYGHHASDELKVVGREGWPSDIWALAVLPRTESAHSALFGMPLAFPA